MQQKQTLAKNVVSNDDFCLQQRLNYAKNIGFPCCFSLIEKKNVGQTNLHKKTFPIFFLLVTRNKTVQKHSFSELTETNMCKNIGFPQCFLLITKKTIYEKKISKDINDPGKYLCTKNKFRQKKWCPILVWACNKTKCQ